ncbi:MAG: tetratricopeptide repeat protein [Deltaproteobacteria bacterium]|nr:tetratricopeptide repeat protein [Deltaproteobacteria bacterium]
MHNPASIAENLQRVGFLVTSGHFDEAESEILRALAAAPGDLRALKLLALIRFKLGRFAEARDAYQKLAAAAPDDAAIRMNLGLIALKLDWVDEATAELEIAVRLRPDDQQAWTYLGYAHVRSGRSVLAADAFRRAGKEDLARQAESGTAASSSQAALRSDAGAEANAVPRDRAPQSGFMVEGFASPQQEPAHDADALRSTSESTLFLPEQSTAELSLTNLLLARAIPELSPEAGAPSVIAIGDDLLAFPVTTHAMVQPSAVVAMGPGLTVAPAQRRSQGRTESDPLLGNGVPFISCDGSGMVWLSPASTGSATSVRLQDDILYYRQDGVLAFADGLAWESGRLPGDGMPMLQMRGSGRVVLDMSVTSLRALRMQRGQVHRVPRARLLGWVGRVVAHAAPQATTPNGGLIVCEGEGMLLLATRSRP